MWEGGASAMEKDLSSSLFSLLAFVIILMCGLVVQLSRPQSWSERADSEADLFFKNSQQTLWCILFMLTSISIFISILNNRNTKKGLWITDLNDKGFELFIHVL